MKKILLFVLFGIATQVSGQSPFPDMDSINANNINALALVHGDMWWNPATAKPHCKFPNGTEKNIEFASAIWMSGYDDAGQLHIAAQTYRQSGNDYWPGPLDGSGTVDYTTSEKWAKIWKVTRAEINAYRGIALHTLSNTPESILTWPGRNNAYAQGKGGVALDVMSEMAPFVDLDGDGKYEPLKGEYPDFNGEQVLWWVFSDNGATHSQTQGVPLKVEVHAMAYAFKRNTLIDNVVYYDYTVINKSTDNYHDFRLALWNDVGIGYYLDDFVGFDSTWRMAIMYKDTSYAGGAGHPANVYGTSPRIAGITLVHLPGDAEAGYMPAGSFMHYNNDPSVMGNPVVDTQYDHYMRSRWRNGKHLANTFAGVCIPNSGYGAGPECNYVFTGDPSIPGGWSECTNCNSSGERKIIFASNDFTLNAGSKQRIVMALVVDSMSGGCPGMNFNRIKEVADTAWGVYHSLPDGIAPQPATVGNGILIYPNPAHDKLTIDCSTHQEDIQVSIYNMVGQRVDITLCKRASKNIVDIGNYPSGIYIVSYQQNGIDKRVMFAKK